MFFENELKFLRHPISQKSELVFKMGIEGCAVDGRSIRYVVNGNRIEVSLFVEQIVKGLNKLLTGSLYSGVAWIYRHATPRFLRISKTNKQAIVSGTQRNQPFVDC
ncbi:hypothetical protein PAESOLCIP111_04313 [Paenibacillus solanacearum]|uniref:Uncharacterized protein n=1 Tax=Paenibacillus solanacearum TaxID=2048548 RepID=A0A916NKH3_9BACL|nr:hypothetical protein PAESOLCIP111_04313 [Paenibacillus solanacearum]